MPGRAGLGAPPIRQPFRLLRSFAMNHRTRLLALLLMLCGCPSAFADPPDEAQPEGSSSEVERLQGTWKLQSLVRDGKKVDPSQIDDMRLILSENEYTFKNQQGQRKVGTFKVHPRRKPAVLETTYAEEPAEGKTVTRIYQWLDKNTFKMCSPGPDERLPDNFESLAGDGREVGVWKHVDE
jgi:uncharacterized protein (TIGR03067 family)